MKNTMILLIVAFLFSAAPVFGQIEYFKFFGAKRTSRSAVQQTAETVAENQEASRSMARLEATRVFLNKGFLIITSSSDAKLSAEIERVSTTKMRCENTSRSRRSCYSEPEFIVYITLWGLDNGVSGVGRGVDKDPRRATEKAANDAANKIKERRGMPLYIF